MNMYAGVLAAMLYGAAASAQSAADLIALGDRDHAAADLRAAFAHYDSALALEPRSYRALCDAAREAVDLGEFDRTPGGQATLYRVGEQYARRAVAVNSQDAEGHFQLARALGRNALSKGTRDRIKFAREVRTEALEALKDDPKHAGALHVMGVWNAEVMRLNGFSRMIAKNFLGGEVFGRASWDEAVRYMEASVAAEPNRLVHRLDLGKVYADVGDSKRARVEFEYLVHAPAVEFNDTFYKEDAARRLAGLKP